MKKIILFALLAVLLAGCYFKAPVAENQTGLILGDGASINQVVAQGRYTNLGFYADIVRIDCTTHTVEWTPVVAELVTKDKQPIGMTISVSARRDCSKADEMWRKYNLEAQNDEAFRKLILGRIPRVAKEVTPLATLDEMLGISTSENSGRGLLALRIDEILSGELAEFYTELVDVGISNIDPSDSYIALLQKKADAQVAVEVAVEEGRLAEENLNKERLQTEVEIELARRQNLINEELAQTYGQSPQFYELERLRLLADVIGDNDKIYFVPQGSDLTLLLGGQGQITPVPGN